MESEPTPNQRLTADQFNDLQINAPTVMEDRGMVGADRLMILHLEPAVKLDDHADLDADFSEELDAHTEIDFRFEACGRCMDLGMRLVFDRMVSDVELPEDLQGGESK